MTVLAVIFTAVGALVGLEWIARNCLALRVWHRAFHLDASHPGYVPAEGVAPRLSVVIAAKDEEHNIAACLQGLLAQDYPNLEFIVVDDRSRDRTADIVRQWAAQDGRLRLVQVRELPDGWCGKNHALQRGIEVCSGEWICTTDADCRMTEPRTLSVALEHARATKADLLSLLPTMLMGSFWEYFLQPVCLGVLVVWFQPKKVNDPRRRQAFANGQFMLMSRRAYQAVGTHEAVKGSLIEDMDLARRVKARGLNLRVAPTRGLISVRMYASRAQFVQGWIRIFLGCFQGLIGLLGALGVLFARGLTPVVVAVVGWAMILAGAQPAKWWAVCAWIGTAGLAAQLAMTFRFYRYAGSPGWMGLLYPLSCIVTGGILLRAMGRKLLGGHIVWKGTAYAAPK
jgi:chlorobactene glucosyltransferase